MEKQVRADVLAAQVGGEILGDGSIQVHALDAIENAGPGNITFLVKSSKKELLAATRASVVIVPPDVGEEERDGTTFIRVKNPYLASAIVHNFLLAEPFKAKGVHAGAHVGENCSITEEITIEPMAVIGKNVTLAARVFVGAGVVIGDDVQIGEDSVIRPNVTIEHGTVIGKRVTIHPGTVIGSDGYGYAPDEKGCHVKRPQVGYVRIDDDVEIGANCCVDRAAYGVTWIKSGTKIDNQVQVAHNVVVGENCLLVSHSAIAGSTTLGRNVILGGKASAAGHIQLGDNVVVAGKGGVTRSQPAGAVVAGMPAIAYKKWTRAATTYGRIPELRAEVRRLRRELEEMRQGEE